MNKFIALGNIKSLIIPFIERDEKGQVVRDQSIVFNKGVKSRNTFSPANIIVSDPSTLDYLRKYKGNEANGGKTFREVIEKKTEVAKAAVPTVEKATKTEAVTVAPTPAKQEETEFVFPDDLAESPVVEESNPTENTAYPEVTTVQEAGFVLRNLDNTLKTRDTNNKDKVLALAVKHRITFPNL
jgi:hypothetical protein